MKIKTHIVKQGSGYSFRVPLALIDCEILDLNKKYILEVKEDSGERICFSDLINQNPLNLYFNTQSQNFNEA